MLISVKLVNPSKKSEYRVEKWHVNKRFDSISEFEEKLKERFKQLKGSLTFGYIEPGHGVKGCQHWIVTDDDIADMYKAYRGKKELIMWCHLYVEPIVGKKTKRSSSEPAASASKRSKCAQKNEKALDDVKMVVSTLESKRGSNYSSEQYNAWAQLINIKKHTSLNDAPFSRQKI